VLQPVDDTLRVRLARHVHPLAKPENLVGTVPPSQPMERMVLVLRPDTVQEEALQELIRAQHDPASVYYHQWLTPQAFGERFGASANDVAQVAGWLETEGLNVEGVTASRRAIVFSGTAGQVENAFHTEMRRYSVQGQIHYANATDPEIPQALAGVVRGIVSLHDFRSAPAHTPAPAYTLSNSVTLLMPKDWDTIYDVGPLYSQGLDGSGQTIAVIGRTDVALSDVRTFRSNAGLPARDPQITMVNGVDPGWPDCADEVESALDVEWAGAIAKSATVNFVTAKSGATDGVVLAAQYAVENDVAPIVSVSYLSCEAAYHDGGQSLWGSLWSQAAAQGQSVLVASGDTGAAGCDSSSETTATLGKAVNAICSTPNSTCVGGTEFSDTATPGAYWAAANGTGLASALSYIPEVAWNETASIGTLTATGGGISAVYAKPSWQSAPGVLAGAMRYVPDISASAGLHDAYVIEIQGGAYYVGGTSAATPSLASVMALVLQNSGSGSLGNVNPALYTLATQQFAGGPAVFHDITSGNNTVPGVTGYTAGTGYDMATGLGSVDAFLLVNSWKNSAAANFSLASSASSLTVAPGKSATTTLTLSAQGGFNSPVTLSAAGAPAGVTVSFSSPALTASSPVTMTVSAAGTASASTGPIAIIGTGGGYKRTIAFTLTVSAATFTLAPSPTVAGVNVGSSTSFSISVAGTNGFASAVALSVGGAPQGVTASFSPATISSGSGSSTLTLSAAATTAAGTYSLSVTGTSGSLTVSQSIVLAIANPNYTLAASPTSASVAPGGSVPITVTTTAGTGFNSIVYLSVSGVPSGVSASFSKTSIAAPGSGTSTLTLSAASTAPAGTYSLTLGAVGGGADKTQALSLTITSNATFTLTPSATTASAVPGSSATLTFTTAGGTGFKSAVALAVSGVPSGVAASFSPTSIASPGSGSSTLTLAVGSAAAAGTYTLTVSAAGGGVTKTQAIGLTVTATFTLAPSATSVSVSPGGSVPLTFATTKGTGFNSAIALAVSGVPAGVTASLSPTSIAAPGTGSSTLTLTAAPTATPATTPVTITATGGGVTKTVTLSLTVTGTFTLASTATAASAARGGSVPLTLTTTRGTGFNSAISFSVGGVPPGVVANFSPSSIAAPGSGSTTLTLAAASSATAGAYALAITATGGGVTKTLAVAYTLLTSSFTMGTTLASTGLAVVAGKSAQTKLSFTGQNAFNSAVTLSISGLPKGVTATFSPSTIAAPGTGTSTLTLAAAAGTAAGTSTLTVTATGGGVTKTLSLTLTVSAH
jgi:uncharacterized membrane protein